MAQISIKFTSGKKIVAPAELWVWAIIESMTERQAERVVEKVLAFKENSFRTQRLLDELAPGGAPAIDISLN